MGTAVNLYTRIHPQGKKTKGLYYGGNESKYAILGGGGEVIHDKMEYSLNPRQSSNSAAAQGQTFTTSNLVTGSGTHGNGVSISGISITPSTIDIDANPSSSSTREIRRIVSQVHNAYGVAYTGASCELVFSQGRDYVSSMSLTLGTPSVIPAGGGSVNSCSYTLTVNWVSGKQQTYVSKIPDGATINWTGVTAGSKGTTISNQTTAGTLRCTVSFDGKTASDNATVYQSGNYVTSIDLTGFAILYSKSVSAAGGTVSPTVTNGSVRYYYSSGSDGTATPSSTYGSLTSAIIYSGSAANGFSSPNATTGAMTASNRSTVTGSTRNSGTVTATRKVTWTPSGSYNSSGDKSDSMSDSDYATQVANAIVSTEYQNCTLTLTEINNRTTVPASGGLRQLNVSGAVQYRYLYTSGSYTGWAAKSIGFDDVTITGSATGFSRSGFNVNVASMGNVFQSSRSCTYTATYATCSSRLTLTQESNSMSTVWRLDWIKGTDITSYNITQPSGGDLYSNAYDTATIRGSGEHRTYGVYRTTTFASGVVEEGYCSLSNFSEKSVSAGDALLESTSEITGGNRAECDYAPYMAETATNNRSGVWYVTAEYSYNNATGVISHFIRLNVNVTQAFVLLQYQIIPTGTLSYTNAGNSPMLWFSMALQVRGDTGTLGEMESLGFGIQPGVTGGTNNGVWETSYMKMGDSYFTVEKLILRLYGNNAGGTYNAQFSLSNLTVSYAGSTVTLSVSPKRITIPPITGGATYIDVPIYTWNNSTRFSLTSVPSDRIIRPSINGGPFTFTFF